MGENKQGQLGTGQTSQKGSSLPTFIDDLSEI
jgi:hypothetical protein